MRAVMTALALAAVVAASPGGAWAQPSSGGPDLGRLHESLRLTPAQERAWAAYVRAVAPDGASEARHREAERMLPTLPTPRRMALIAATMAADEADFHRHAGAVNAFYAGLTPAQQHVFDDQTRPPAESLAQGRE
ncbi:MAG: Spy/CpxP family protein refolding chaperone [Phenylobacterium sp.]